jgi:hypothetical protein
MRTLATTVLSLLGDPIEPEFGALPYRPTEIMRMFGDSTRAHQLLGWTPRHTLEEGLTRTIDWYRTHLFSAAGPGPSARQRLAPGTTRRLRRGTPHPHRPAQCAPSGLAALVRRGCGLRPAASGLRPIRGLAGRFATSLRGTWRWEVSETDMWHRHAGARPGWCLVRRGLRLRSGRGGGCRACA